MMVSFVSVIVTTLTFIKLSQGNLIPLYDRNPKWFGIGFVRFQNGVCLSSNNLNGTCYTRWQCQGAGGTPSGRCAQNIAFCCVIYRTCGESSRYNNTYFTNQNWPASETSGGSCIMTIIKCSPDICQVRLDFLGLTLAQPNATGVCTVDSFVVIGGAGPVPVICGDNTGQHIYVDFNGNNTIEMIISLAESEALGRNWNIKVTQIACDCPTRAPIGCLMYYTAASGTVTSFNYGTSTNMIDPNTGQPGTRELVNENYGVCVAMIPGYCSIEWSSCTDDSFIVTDNDAAVFPPVTSWGDNCTTDFIIIPNPYFPNGTAAPSDRICGNTFPTLISYSKPFVLTVVTNGDEVNDVGNIGFCLNYRQRPCSSSANILGR